MDTANPTALLVDDELTSRAAQSARLEGEGYTVFVAQNQADALSRAKQVAPKVIFAHLGRSGLGNLALIQALRSDDTCRHIPVVVVSADATPRQIRQLLASGAAGYVTKPIDVAELRAIVDPLFTELP